VTLMPGDLLIAPPSLRVTAWAGSVIMLTNTHPYQGLVINKPTDIPVSRITPGIESYMDTDIHWGGPVNLTTVWMLHSPDWEMYNTYPVGQHWAVTSNQHMFERVAQGDWPEHWRVCSGCSQWAPGQLEQEIDQVGQGMYSQGWLTLHQPSPEFVFEHDSSDLWQAAIDQCRQQAVSAWMA